MEKIKHIRIRGGIFWRERMMPVNSYVFLSAGASGALEYANAKLSRMGCAITREIRDDVTHLLLPVPSFEGAGTIKGGIPLQSLLEQLPQGITVIGGNLDVPELAGHKKLDLLQNADYLAQNAAITAHCALKLMLTHLPCTPENLPILVIGWGRIGKCLARLLRNVDASVTVAARKPEDRAMLRALGYGAMDYPIDTTPYRVIFNTVPAPVLEECAHHTLKIDLASTKGIAGDDVVHARGLPGKDAPESAGGLIADTVLHLFRKEDRS